MHYIINPEGIKMEIEKLRHSVTNIWNIKQYRTKLHSPYSSWNRNLPRITKMYSMSNTYNNAKYNLNRPDTKEILLNVQTAKDMGTRRTTATLNQGASNAQVIT
jgi:hypothetical protein